MFRTLFTSGDGGDSASQKLDNYDPFLNMQAKAIKIRDFSKNSPGNKFGILNL